MNKLAILSVVAKIPSKTILESRARRHMPLIPVLRRKRQADL